MVKKMLKKLIQKNNKGVGIVTVIVAISFVSILVSTLMLTSAVNFKMRNMNTYAKDSFYSAEQVLDEIQVGLQNLVSDGIRVAYSTMLQEYSVEGLDAEEKNELIKAEYYNYIWDNIADGNTDTYVAMPAVQDPTSADCERGLYKFLKPATRWHGNTASNETNYGAFLRGNDTVKDPITGEVIKYTGTIKNYKDKGIVLEGVEIYYKDPSGFVSVIKTDIILGFPKFAFSNNSMPDVSEYCIIADSGIEAKLDVRGDIEPNNININGSLYAYSADLTGYNIKFSSAAANSGRVTQIFATDYLAKKGGIVTDENTVLWAGDVVLDSSKAVLDGENYIRDDINLSGHGSSLKIGGYLTAYGNSIVSAQDSSAILVNGVGTSIDMSNARNVTIAGRGFISTSTRIFSKDADAADTAQPDGEAPAVNNLSDLYTGESIAVKGSQMMYLVPAECIGVSKDNKKSVFGKNPLSRDEYNVVMSNDNIDEVSSTVHLNMLKGTSTLYDDTLSSYVALKGDGTPEVQKIFVNTSDGQIVYYYMMFSSEKAANEYYLRRFNFEKENKQSGKRSKTEDYIATYLSLLKLPDDATSNQRVDAAAYITVGSKDYVDAFSPRNHITKDVPSRDFQEMSDSYLHQFRALTSKLSTDYETLEEAGNIMRFDLEDNKAVFLNLIDEATLAQVGSTIIPDKNGNKLVQLIYDDTAKGKTPEDPDNIKSGEYTYYFDGTNPRQIDADCRLVIANCDVYIDRDFTGTIITKGKIIIKNSCTLTTDRSAVENSVTTKISDTMTVAELFKDMSSGLIEEYFGEGYESGNVSAASLVTFDRWLKN